ncbi:hypothetical protein DRW48_09035 [Paracoccus suum]|uniref:Uncharacterized protein n=1 Tax=Paracoccus suum TaxID=2259340 RepID=A0A344PKA7_9RHOB|nr:hypothetical protein [Paracoccus suum]AXC49812.1 hypothetical protein DRW48_09035 [Paracoccus suum]
MTALAQYQRLEAAGTWRPGPSAQRREVIVSFGDATLVLSDPRSEVPLSHWSLPAVMRLNPGRLPALYAPAGATGDEELEVADPLMIGAIDKIHHAIAQARPHPGRLRSGGMAAIAVALFAVAAWWLPGAMLDYAIRIAPPAQRLAIGNSILDDMTRVTGPACGRPAPAQVLARLGPRLLGQGGRIEVLPAGLKGARTLPGRITVMGPNLLDAGEVPAEAALGHVIAADAYASEVDPLRGALQHAGSRAVLQLLTRGGLPPGALDGYGQSLLTAPEPRASDDPLLAAFTRAGVPSEPYARDVDPSGESTLVLIEADPYRTRLPDQPPLTKDEWQTLRGICDE